ncbi:hypothetical protein AJ80_01266 [Polytolypa hystricis UAMH7299]|uniref:Glycerate kinase n=1 Tax=Polytolypa hystricis (strain UAMH7299) TaxID=1447883 RepID=A0A2B7Z0X8_POLH7|nr:hypothetical protein AJ80_01266 [Polytolypa hystricis UAMH7299]
MHHSFNILTTTTPSESPEPPLKHEDNRMRILICPSGFKESLDTHVVADCIEEGVRRIVPDAVIKKVPLFDGGEGFAKALITSTGGTLRDITITGPVNQPVASQYGLLGDNGPKTAVIDMAAAAGLRLVPKDLRDPTVTTTYGVGELLFAALEEGVERILVGCGDSGTSDGGAGMLQALGARLLDKHGHELPLAQGGKSLSTLADIDRTHLHPRLREVEIEVACNFKNVLCGPKGVARVYGPQKGATPAQVEMLAAALDTYGLIVSRKLGQTVSSLPGSGASGGLGAGLLLLGAKLRPRYEAITEYFGINDDLFRDNHHLVFTAEGKIDAQTTQGKIPAEIAVRAKKHGLPVIALAGTVGDDANANYGAGIDAYTSIMQGPMTLEDAMEAAERLLRDSAETAMRMVMLGKSLNADIHTTASAPVPVPVPAPAAAAAAGAGMTKTKAYKKVFPSLSMFTFVCVSFLWLAALYTSHDPSCISLK